MTLNMTLKKKRNGCTIWIYLGFSLIYTWSSTHTGSNIYIHLKLLIIHAEGSTVSFNLTRPKLILVNDQDHGWLQLAVSVFVVFLFPKSPKWVLLDQDRSPWSKINTLKLNWKLQLPIWPSQMPSGKDILFTEKTKIDPSGHNDKRYVWRWRWSFKQKNIVPTVQHGGGSIMLFCQWYWYTARGLPPNSLISLQINSLMA